MDMVKLKECVFNDCDITGDGLTRLTALPGSKKLVLPDIDINDDHINGLATLDKFDLVLKNTNCSMAQLRKLGQIKGMTSINLLGSQSTSEQERNGKTLSILPSIFDG